MEEKSWKRMSSVGLHQRHINCLSIKRQKDLFSYEKSRDMSAEFTQLVVNTDIKFLVSRENRGRGNRSYIVSTAKRTSFHALHNYFPFRRRF